jgi:hypothetical protein
LCCFMIYLGIRMHSENNFVLLGFL